ncbi:TD and POZ domain-containing protein 4-like [Uloborus diversus]|uniref:TD and POZ domain-containing protein 4-like n=1 Tax=Uloborus diversus TaxID=327109 RepID=UPI00240975A6|nr:TD and POZ domain-containing protein 4-like [Uloborus diversus]
MADSNLRLLDREAHNFRSSHRGYATGSLHLDTNFTNALLNSSLSDVTLKVGKVEFPAHKIILASRSKVFQGMFESGMKESQENVVNLVEMQETTAENMLQYIYTGCIKELTMEGAFDLYVAADRYDLRELVVCCQDFILKNISAEHVCEVAALANVHNDEELAMASKITLKENFKEVLNSEKWRAFAKNQPDLYTELLESSVLIEKIE